MKRIFIVIALFVGILPLANAQWTSPGNGTEYSLKELSEISNGTVVKEGGDYIINADLTISASDILTILDDCLNIIVRDALITINGSMVCRNDLQVTVKGDPIFSFLFDGAASCVIKNIDFSYGSGIKLINTSISFENCNFINQDMGYSSAAVSFFMCGPVFRNCRFIENEGAAISSAANNQSSPKIYNCVFERNVTSNANTPQINLGPGGMLDTIYIVENTINGAYDNVGGISVSDMLGVGNTKVLLKNNIIRNNRYGYNQQGNSISSLIIGNEFVGNNLETNPENGGSGVSIYGSSTNCKAKLRHNLITGSLWGVTAINLNNIDMGTVRDWGFNQIFDNSNNQTHYDLYNNSSCDITAVGNWWGIMDENEVENRIVHKNDNPDFGLVTYLPLWNVNAVNEDVAADFAVVPNPVRNGVITVVFGQPAAGEVNVYNITGQKIQSQPVDNDMVDARFEIYEAGTYIVEVKTATGRSVKKVIVM